MKDRGVSGPDHRIICRLTRNSERNKYTLPCEDTTHSHEIIIHTPIDYIQLQRNIFQLTDNLTQLGTDVTCQSLRNPLGLSDANIS